MFNVSSQLVAEFINFDAVVVHDGGCSNGAFEARAIRVYHDTDGKVRFIICDGQVFGLGYEGADIRLCAGSVAWWCDGFHFHWVEFGFAGHLVKGSGVGLYRIFCRPEDG